MPQGGVGDNGLPPYVFHQGSARRLSSLIGSHAIWIEFEGRHAALFRLDDMEVVRAVASIVEKIATGRRQLTLGTLFSLNKQIAGPQGNSMHRLP